MDLAKLNNQELHLKIKTLAGEERRLTQEVVSHIAEIDRRKLYLKMAFPSLFEYLVRGIGYSEGSAQRRIDAARILQRIPEVASQIEGGSLNLGQISKVQRICRDLKKNNGTAVDVDFQKQVLFKIQNQGSRNTDLILAQEFGTEIEVEEKNKIQRDESVRIELTFSKENMEIINQAKSLLSNKTGGGLKNTILEMARRTIKSFEPKQKVTAEKEISKIHPESACRKSSFTETPPPDNPQSQSKNRQLKKDAEIVISSGVHSDSPQGLILQQSFATRKDEIASLAFKNNLNAATSTIAPATSKVTATVAVTETSNPIHWPKVKPLTPKTKRQILFRDQCCQFKDHQTGNVCGSTLFLNVDHIHPKFAGGNNELQNLQILCAAHNQFRYESGKNLRC